MLLESHVRWKEIALMLLLILAKARVRSQQGNYVVYFDIGTPHSIHICCSMQVFVSI